MWTDSQFWKDTTWRAFRTFCQTLAGLLLTTQAVSAFTAPWSVLLGASAMAAVISLLQSVDRGRAVSAITPADPPAQAPFVATFVNPVTGGCGTNLR